jgi:hypothetical protein
LPTAIGERLVFFGVANSSGLHPKKKRVINEMKINNWRFKLFTFKLCLKQRYSQKEIPYYKYFTKITDPIE